jgi:hypothetical protein
VTGDWRADEPSADRWAAGDEPDGRSAWDAGDQRASDAFSLPGARSGRAGGSADYDQPYGSQHGSGGTHQSGELEPLPEPAGQSADWHSAPVHSGDFADGRDGQGWDDGGYDSGHDGYPAADRRDGYAGSGPGWEPGGTDRDWPGAAGGDRPDRDQPGWAEPGYGHAGGYHQEQGYGPAAGSPQAQAGDYSLRGSHRGSVFSAGETPHGTFSAEETPYGASSAGATPYGQGYGRASHDMDFPSSPGYDEPADDGYGERAGYGQQPRHGHGPR